MTAQHAADHTRAFAPGRVNLIGEHTDYNDGFVLPFALELGCTATVQPGGDGWVAASVQQDTEVVTSACTQSDVPGWATYVLGPLWLLAARGVEVPPLRIEVDSNVPLGAGLSSSAALVCSVITAIDEALSLGMSDEELLVLSREVENDVVGAPTGGMDQLVSLRAETGHALFCDMRSLDTDPVPFDLDDAGLSMLVVDTNAPHRHVDGEYAERRSGCEEAARALGVPALRDVTSEDLAAAVERLEEDRLQRYVRHVVTEDERVLETAALLRDGDVAGIGPLLTASHASMRDDFQISVPEVDGAVEALLGAGALGARMTGGGFGGCVIGLLPQERVDAAREAVARRFEEAAWKAPTSFLVTPGPGAHVVGG
jgi:galactokinase